MVSQESVANKAAFVLLLPTGPKSESSELKRTGHQPTLERCPAAKTGWRRVPRVMMSNGQGGFCVFRGIFTVIEENKAFVLETEVIRKNILSLA